MKKLVLVGALALFGAMNAQEYKPGAGSVSTEFGLAGGLGNTSLELPGGNAHFKARYFKTENLAYRASFSLGSSTSKTDIDTYNDQGLATEIHETGKDKESSTSFLMGFGLEKHFKGTERLSPYVGAELLIGYDAQKDTAERNYVNSGLNTTSYVRDTKLEVKGPNAFSFGIRGVFGADYYFVKNVFLGVEAGLGLMYSSEGKTKSSYTSTITTGGVTSSSSLSAEAPGGSEFVINPHIVTGVRIGYVF